MKKIILILLFHFFIWTHAQKSKIEFLQINQEIENIFISNPIKIEQTDNNPFIAFSIALEGTNINQNIENVYFKNRDNKWKLFPKSEHNDEKNVWYALVFLDKNIQNTQLKVVLKTATLFNTVKLNFYHPKETSYLKKQGNSKPKLTTEITGCNCAKPPTIQRDEWCPNNNCPPNSNPVATDVKFLVVHHTAMSNTASDWAAVVRAIWDFHVNTRGWADIGYNFLIDKNGKIYDAREDNTKGAHFSGHNSQTSGISLMGTFTNVTPTNEMINALEGLLSWKSCDKTIDPLAIGFHSSSNLNLHTIPGHRDGGSTVCPGDQVYNLLPDIRTNVNTQLNACTLALDSYNFSDMNIFPNPFAKHFTISSTDIDFNAIKISIHTVIGKEVYQKIKNNSVQQTTIHLDFLPLGIYILTIQGDQKIARYRLIKK